MVTSLFLTEKISDQTKTATSLLLIRESIKRYDTYAFEPHELFLENGVVKASVHKVSVDNNGDIVADNTAKVIELDNNCIIHIRKDPPFDMVYYTAVYSLSMIVGNSYVTNNPLSIINTPEKFIPAELQEFTPPTLISADHQKIKEFWDKNEDIILKPLYEFGGKNVFRLKKGDGNHISILGVFKQKYKEPIIAQKYLPEVKKGDKRIILINGEVAFKILRIPEENTLQSSVDLGASYTKTELTSTEKRICEILKPILVKKDIFLCGIDIIGNYLTEINVTNTALFTPINKLATNDSNYIPAEKTYWDRLENKLKSLK